MTDYCFEPQVQTTLGVEGTEKRFPVRRVYCVGRNYADHALEMGGNPDREPPFFFMKPADAVIQKNAMLGFPSKTENLHFEVELVVALKRGGSNISLKEASDCVHSYAVGVDLTRRDLQQVAKDARRPWDLAKGFDESAPVSMLVEANSVGDLAERRIWLSVNGEVKQDGKLGQMIWNIPETISYLSDYVELKQGDLIMTGTPAGVGQVVPGDEIRAGVEGIAEFGFSYSDRRG